MADRVALEPEREEAATTNNRTRPDVKQSRRDQIRTHLRERRETRWLLLGAAVVLVAALIGTWRYFAVRESTDDAQIDGHIHPIAARVGGTVVAVNVKDNRQVAVGALLVQIDPRDYQVARARAQADLAEEQAAAQAARTGVPVASTTTSSQVTTANAALQQTEAGVTAAARDVDTARARLGSAQARLREVQANETKALQDLDRMKRLIVKDEVSQQQYEAAVAVEEAARAARDAAQAAVNEAQRRVEAAEARLVQARGAVSEARAGVAAAKTAPEQVAIMQARAASAEAKAQQARAMLEQAQLNLQYTSVRAPIGGIVSKKSVEVGQIVQPGQTLLAIVPLEDIWVTANFKEGQLKNMRPGQPAVISVDAYGGRKYRGHVDSIAAATGARFSLLPPENATGNYVKVVQRVPVKIVFEKGQDPEHLLRPGMSVVPTVVTK